MEYAGERRKQIASADPLERLIAEIKRCTDVVGLPRLRDRPTCRGVVLEPSDELQLE